MAVITQVRILVTALFTSETLIFTKKVHQVDMTKFDELEETHAEVRMKQRLWESLKEWDEVTNEWFDKKFDQLDPEDITQVKMEWF